MSSMTLNDSRSPFKLPRLFSFHHCFKFIPSVQFNLSRTTLCLLMHAIKTHSCRLLAIDGVYMCARARWPRARPAAAASSSRSEAFSLQLPENMSRGARDREALQADIDKSIMIVN